jgi:hypothetical protein
MELIGHQGFDHGAAEQPLTDAQRPLFAAEAVGRICPNSDPQGLAQGRFKADAFFVAASRITERLPPAPYC